MPVGRLFEITLTGTVAQGAPITAAGAEASGNTANIIGIADSSGVSGDTIAYTPVGESVLALCDGTSDIAAGDELMVGESGGTLVVYASDTGHVRVGRALEALTTDGERLIRVALYAYQPTG